ncbi:fibroblast growth factor 22 isoform X1 [Diceros bicornis minor]|uniref:fibroblast growth factor 22 isoform X1 n=1 Tax=Diceros bicornis minor TaxID=77932 RepID=UPI0026E97BA2|nr:fibroblast growth factor 22 isoform X1 [Diceros bicornis minor]
MLRADVQEVRGPLRGGGPGLSLIWRGAGRAQEELGAWPRKCRGPVGHGVSSPLPLASKSRLKTRGQGLGSRCSPSARVEPRVWAAARPPALLRQTGNVGSAQAGHKVGAWEMLSGWMDGSEGTRWQPGQQPLPTGVLEIRSLRVGVVALKAVHSGFYVAMSRRGCLYGSRVCTVHCRFRERIEENGYNTYASVRWHRRARPMFLALDGQGAPRCGGQTRRHHPSTHFLPILVS